AIPRRREKKKEDKANDADIVKRLKQICTDADPTRIYRNLVKICPGVSVASAGVFTSYRVGTNLSVAIKQMDLDRQPKKDLIINEILVMRALRQIAAVNRETAQGLQHLHTHGVIHRDIHRDNRVVQSWELFAA
ncbi:hypothetical protein V8E52_011649, partial [Russula decolorans]